VAVRRFDGTMAPDRRLAAPVRGEIARRRLADGSKQTYYLYVPLRLRRPESMFVAVHGISRNALEHARAFAIHAEARGVVLVAPRFDAGRLPHYQRLGTGTGPARADLALVRIAAEVSRLTGAPDDRMYLYGHSGGAQFVHRFAMAHPHAVARYALSAAGQYTLPDTSLAFPLGTGATSRLPGVRFDARRFLRVPGLVLVGDRDTRRDPSLPQSRRLDRLLGRTRAERARNWAFAMTVAARRLGYSTNFPFVLLPNSGHGFGRLVSAGDLGRTVFEWLFDAAD
jgi:pimeloyl-ACP methyl ester carboxylesterase